MADDLNRNRQSPMTKAPPQPFEIPDTAKSRAFMARNPMFPGHWSGDLFDKRNPLWQRVGVVKPGKDGRKLTVLNTGAARSECGRALRQLLSMDKDVASLVFLANR